MGFGGGLTDPFLDLSLAGSPTGCPRSDRFFVNSHVDLVANHRFDELDVGVEPGFVKLAGVLHLPADERLELLDHRIIDDKLLGDRPARFHVGGGAKTRVAFTIESLDDMRSGFMTPASFCALTAFSS